MKAGIIVITLLLTAAFSTNAQLTQEKILYDALDKKTDSANCDHYSIFKYDDTTKVSGTEMKYSKDNILLSDVHYSNIEHHKRFGKAIYYFADGSLHASMNYNENGFNGELTSYYKSGQLLRRDSFADDKFITGRCFTAEGKDTTHFDYEIMPQFPGGEDKLLRYIMKNLHYPHEAAENGIMGRVYVTFNVTKTGEIENVKTIRNIGGGCDEEAIRVVKNMPAWSPGFQDGVPVKVQFVLPINFSLR